MKRTILPITAICISLLALDSRGDESPHAYFDALIARPDHWKSYSLRDPRQLGYPTQGGYAHASSGQLFVTYSPTTDSDSHRQDAAKVVIPAFIDLGTVPSGKTGSLATAIDATQTTIPITNLTSTYQRPRTLLIDNEIVNVIGPLDYAQGLAPVERGAFGTTPEPHTAGSLIRVSQNGLTNQIRLPLGTSDGNTYMFTWDEYWTDSYVSTGLTNHKWVQFSNSNGRWMELQTRFDGGVLQPSGFRPGQHVAGLELRAYLTIGGAPEWSLTNGHYLGPGGTHLEPLRPNSGTFIIHPNRWTRFWVRIEQLPNDYDYMDLWVADEVTGPVQIYTRIPYSVYPDGKVPNSIDKVWLEFDTSTTQFTRGSMRDLVTYVRNFVALVNPPREVSPLLLRPLAGTPLPLPPRPRAPLNPRIVQ